MIMFINYSNIYSFHHIIMNHYYWIVRSRNDTIDY